MEKEEELIERLWRDSKARSRNANFTRFRDDLSFRRAVKHVRSLLAFRSDIERFRGQSLVVVRWIGSGSRALVSLRAPMLRLRRSLFVSKQELDLLREEAAWREADVVFDDRGVAANDPGRRA